MGEKIPEMPLAMTMLPIFLALKNKTFKLFKIKTPLRIKNQDLVNLLFTFLFRVLVNNS